MKTGTKFLQTLATTALITIALLAVLKQIPQWVAGWYFILSTVSYLVYYNDKKAATANKWRTPENTLQLLSFAGGWPGALLAQTHLRHKTKKRSFLTIFWILTIAHMCIAAYLLKII